MACTADDLEAVAGQKIRAKAKRAKKAARARWKKT